MSIKINTDKTIATKTVTIIKITVTVCGKLLYKNSIANISAKNIKNPVAFFIVFVFVVNDVL